MPESAFSDSLTRHIRNVSQNVGGSPHAAGEAVIPGIHPCPDLVFFDDFVQIDINQSNTNLHNPVTGPPTSFLTFNNELLSSGDVDMTQLFLKAERSFNRIRCLVLPLKTHIWDAAFGDFDAPANDVPATDERVDIKLITSALGVGATPPNKFGLDKLTWDNSHVPVEGDLIPPPDPPGGTIIGNPDFSRQSFGIKGPKANEDYQIEALEPAWVMFFANIVVADQGPYNGIQFFYNPQFQGGAPDDQDNASGKLLATIESIVQTLDPGGEFFPRAFAITDDFDVAAE